VGVIAVGELADLGDAFLAAFGDDIRGAERGRARCGRCAGPSGRSVQRRGAWQTDGQQADGAVADDGDGGAWGGVPGAV
jgi:hypothetical protein